MKIKYILILVLALMIIGGMGYFGISKFQPQAINYSKYKLKMTSFEDTAELFQELRQDPEKSKNLLIGESSDILNKFATAKKIEKSGGIFEDPNAKEKFAKLNFVLTCNDNTQEYATLSSVEKDGFYLIDSKAEFEKYPFPIVPSTKELPPPLSDEEQKKAIKSCWN